MAQRYRLDITNLYVDKLHRPADTKDKKSLPVGMPHHRGHDDMPGIHHPVGSKP